MSATPEVSVSELPAHAFLSSLEDFIRESYSQSRTTLLKEGRFLVQRVVADIPSVSRRLTLTFHPTSVLDKERISRGLQIILAELNVTRYVFIAEVWHVSVDTKNLPEEEVERLLAETAPSESPLRVEGLFLSAQERGKVGAWNMFGEITRNADGTIKEVPVAPPLEFFSDTKGRFGNLMC